MVRTVSIQEAQANLAELLTLVRAGNEVLITEAEQPVVRLTPAQRIPNLHPGAMTPSDDFDEPLPEEFWLGTDEITT